MLLEYVFDDDEREQVLLALGEENFVGKVLDVSKGAQARKKRGMPDEYLYVFKCLCKLIPIECVRDERHSIVLYIKICDRYVPKEQIRVVSMHKNEPKNK